MSCDVRRGQLGIIDAGLDLQSSSGQHATAGSYRGACQELPSPDLGAFWLAQFAASFDRLCLFDMQTIVADGVRPRRQSTAQPAHAQCVKSADVQMVPGSQNQSFLQLSRQFRLQR